ncbi:hypothetical protein [Nocardioides jishulii]|uniref:hypothetical protein n=1 Tax=Nocardioides jishulii TaxID=2575440 RepID=UPI001586E2E5|nr:hypothetical protein [Nocardioides jishulii]
MLKILLVVLLVAVTIYLVTRTIERRGGSRSPRGPRGGAARPPRQVAPDDDPDFLWDLERKRRREAKEQGQTPPDQDEANGEDSTGTS